MGLRSVCDVVTEYPCIVDDALFDPAPSSRIRLVPPHAEFRDHALIQLEDPVREEAGVAFGFGQPRIV